jgi:hypothetical protein
MSSSTTNGINRAYDSAVIAAEGVRQAAVTPTTAQATVIAAEITYYRAAVKAALANGVSPSGAMVALRSLGGDRSMTWEAPMGISPTGNRAFDAAALLAEQIRQTAQAGSPTQAQARAADLAWFNAVIAAAAASGGAITVPNEVASLAAIIATGNP